MRFHVVPAGGGFLGRALHAYQEASVIRRLLPRREATGRRVSWRRTRPGTAIRTDHDLEAAGGAAFRSDVFEQIGGFDESFARGEDTEFTRRLRAAGIAVHYAPGVRIRHRNDPRLGAALKIAFANGRASWRLMRRAGAESGEHPRPGVAGAALRGGRVLLVVLARLANRRAGPLPGLLARFAAPGNVFAGGIFLRRPGIAKKTARRLQRGRAMIPGRFRARLAKRARRLARPANRTILLEMVRANIKASDYHSLLGGLWSLIGTAAMLASMYFVFSRHFGRGIPGYPLYLLTGIIMVNFFITATSYLLKVLSYNRDIALNSTIPRENLVLATISINAWKFAIELAICTAISLAYGFYTWKSALLFVPSCCRSSPWCWGSGWPCPSPSASRATWSMSGPSWRACSFSLRRFSTRWKACPRPCAPSSPG